MLSGVVSYKGDGKVGVGRCHERVVAVDVGDGAIGGAGLEDSGADYGQTVVIDDAAFDGHVASLRRLSHSLVGRRHDCRWCEGE